MNTQSDAKRITKVLKEMNDVTDDAVLCTGRFAKSIGVSKSTILKWVRLGLLKPVSVVVDDSRFHYEFSEQQVKQYFMNNLFESNDGVQEDASTNLSDYLSLNEFASKLGVSRTTVLNWIKMGFLAPHHTNPSGSRFFSTSQFDKLVVKKNNNLSQFSIKNEDSVFIEQSDEMFILEMLGKA